MLLIFWRVTVFSHKSCRLVSDEYRVLLTVDDMRSVDIRQVYSTLLSKSYILCIANVVSLGCIMGKLFNYEFFSSIDQLLR
jgi:hypothetical protein